MILCKNSDIECILVLEQINKVLKLFPKNHELHILKSDYFFQIGDTTSAILELERSYINNKSN